MESHADVLADLLTMPMPGVDGPELQGVMEGLGAGGLALALASRGIVKRRTGDLKGARVDLDAAISNEPASSQLFVARALIRNAMRDRGGAWRDVLRAEALRGRVCKQ